jgi:putative cardiolipin synthase
MAKALYDAAERGVRVRILLDDMNAKDKDALMMALDAHPNIEIRLYNPFRNRSGIARTLELVQRAFSVNHRMHNKSWIADGRVAIVGGRNIGEEYFSARDDANFQDLDLVVAGPPCSRPTGSSTTTGTAARIPISALACIPMNSCGTCAQSTWMRCMPGRSPTCSALAGRRLQRPSPSRCTGARTCASPPIRR